MTTPSLLRLLARGDEVAVEKGDFWRTPGNVPHTMKAGPEGAVVLDVFSPPRDEYRKPGAGFGTQEGGWVLGFGLLGVERELALSTGIAVHLAQLFNTALFGAIGHVAMGMIPAAAGEGAQKPPLG